MKILLLTAAAALLCLAGCKTSEPVTSAAENGLREEIKPVGEVLAFREVRTEESEAPGGKSAVVHFEGEVKWYTLEEALSSQGSAHDAQEYLVKLESVSSKLAAAPKAGSSGPVKGAILLAKTDVGWRYTGLAAD